MEDGKSFSFPEDIFSFSVTFNKYILISLQANHGNNEELNCET